MLDRVLNALQKKEVSDIKNALCESRLNQQHHHFSRAISLGKFTFLRRKLVTCENISMLAHFMPLVSHANSSIWVILNAICTICGVYIEVVTLKYSIKQVVLKNSTKFTGKPVYRSLLLKKRNFSIDVLAWSFVRFLRTHLS